MHRVFAFLLLSVLSFGLIAPAVSQNANLQLPPCCRAHGKHHCAMKQMMAMQNSADSGVSRNSVEEKCPYLPKAGMMAFHSQTYLQMDYQVFFGELVSHPAVHAQTEARFRISFSRSRQKRGPPSVLLS